MNGLFIVGAKRTPQGRLSGALAKWSAADLARKTYGSFATAWNVRRAFTLLTQATSSYPGAPAV